MVKVVKTKFKDVGEESELPPPLPKEVNVQTQVLDALFGDPSPNKRVKSFKSAIRALEVELIRDALVETKGNKSKAARLLNLNRTTLLMKIQKLGIEHE
jgi:DNA-binding NtrC family response regulator